MEYFRLLGGGVQLGPLGTAATDWPIVGCPEWLWWWRIWWNEDWQGKPKYSEKTRPSAILSTTNPTWPDPGSNPTRRGGKIDGLYFQKRAYDFISLMIRKLILCATIDIILFERNQGLHPYNVADNDLLRLLVVTFQALSLLKFHMPYFLSSPSYMTISHWPPQFNYTA
jgi:hypothetical protein